MNPGFKIAQDRYLNILLYADDLAIVQDNETNLQISVFKLNQICEQYNMKISTAKTKVMAFRGKQPVRTKIIINDQTIEQVNHFNYLGHDIGYDKDYDIDKKLAKFQGICGTINRTFKHKIRRDKKLKFYKVMAIPLISSGSELWTLNKNQKSKIQASEMKFLSGIKGCTKFDHI